VPSTDTYIEKDTAVNERIEEYRLEAASSVVSRNDVIVVASVSCIYGLGDPNEYKQGIFQINVGRELGRDNLIRALVQIQFERNDTDLRSGRFRVRGNTIDLIQGYGRNIFRINFKGETIESIKVIEPINLKVLEEIDKLDIFPASPFMTSRDSIERALKSIETELKEVLPTLPQLEAHRLEKEPDMTWK